MFLKKLTQHSDILFSFILFFFFLYFFRIFDSPITTIDVKTHHVKYLKTTSGKRTQIRDHVKDIETGKHIKLIAAYAFYRIPEKDKENLIIQVVRDPMHRYTNDLYLVKVESKTKVYHSKTLEELNNNFFFRRVVVASILLLIPLIAIFRFLYKKRSAKFIFKA